MKDCRRIVSFPYVSLDSLPSPRLCVTIWVQSNAIRASSWQTSASHFLCTAHELYGLRWQSEAATPLSLYRAMLGCVTDDRSGGESKAVSPLRSATAVHNATVAIPR